MEQIRINLGCGKRKVKGYINIDIDPAHEPDLILDLSKCALPYGDNSVDEVRAFDFLEHIPLGKTIFVIDEIWRVLKPGGKFEHFTPSTDGRGAFQDPTHLSFWNINSWLYFTDGIWANMYGIKSKFKVEQLRDIITSDALRIIHTHGIFTKEQA
ncbi:MAG: methyltransferase domain-containing protein [Deltaproteobacteria bacterium]|nr:methyltransferase domain-containing protein [Deltaproteobacteria bacterium]